MPNTKQAKKRMVTGERRRVANKVKRSEMKTAIKKVLAAESADDARAAMPFAIKKIDKCAKHNIIHANAAARSKSRLAKYVGAK